MNKKLLLALVGIAILIAGVVAGVLLLQQNQDIRKEASGPGGTATISISPESGQFEVGEEFEVDVSFNPKGISISTIAVRLSYTFEGGDPEILAKTPQISSDLLSTGDWACPIKKVDIGNSIVNIDISCAYTTTTGFSSESNVLLATIPFTAKEETTNPVNLEFDTIQSIITQKSDASDILLTPTSTGSYSVGSSGTSLQTTTPTPTPTPTTPPGGDDSGSENPTLTPAPTATDSISSGSGGNTQTTTPTPKATAPSDLPESGVSLPTFIALGAALILLGLSVAVII